MPDAVPAGTVTVPLLLSVGVAEPATPLAGIVTDKLTVPTVAV